MSWPQGNLSTLTFIIRSNCQLHTLLSYIFPSRKLLHLHFHTSVLPSFNYLFLSDFEVVESRGLHAFAHPNKVSASQCLVRWGLNKSMMISSMNEHKEWPMVYPRESEFWKERLVPSGLERSIHCCTLLPLSCQHLVILSSRGLVRWFDVTVIIYIRITCNVMRG